MSPSHAIDSEKSTDAGTATIPRPETNLDVEQFGPDLAGQDVAMAIVGEQAHAIDPIVEARVIRKIDLFLIPAMIVGYGFVYYDKVGILSLHQRMSSC
jgi:hypothetical protein